MKRIIIIISLAVFAFAACDTQKKQTVTDPLPSWREGSAKGAIVDFVTKVTAPGTEFYVPEEDRIATFDNDGTLWAEKPVVQLEFIVAQVGRAVKTNPDMAEKQPFKAVAERDMAALKTMDEKQLFELFALTIDGFTSEQYRNDVRNYADTAHYPGRGVQLKQIRYQPQLELLQYLHDNGFKVFICTGGTVDFVRAISKDFYGIEPERVIGSYGKATYEGDDRVNDIILSANPVSFNDKQEKPVNIYHFIGKRPILACGNEGGGGDVYMLRYSQGGTYPSLQLIVNHDDAEREYAYSEDPDISLLDAEEHGWQIVSIKDDWATVFAQ